MAFDNAPSQTRDASVGGGVGLVAWAYLMA